MENALAVLKIAKFAKVKNAQWINVTMDFSIILQDNVLLAQKIAKNVAQKVAPNARADLFLILMEYVLNALLTVNHVHLLNAHKRIVIQASKILKDNAFLAQKIAYVVMKKAVKSEHANLDLKMTEMENAFLVQKTV